MSPARIAADTDRLNSAALRHAAREIQHAVRAFESGVAGVGQVVLHQRNSELDRYVTRLVTEVPAITTMLFSLIGRAGQGDAAATADMANFFEDAEELNLVTAGGGYPGAHH
jgi:hypothetical protein